MSSPPPRFFEIHTPFPYISLLGPGILGDPCLLKGTPFYIFQKQWQYQNSMGTYVPNAPTLFTPLFKSIGELGILYLTLLLS